MAIGQSKLHTILRRGRLLSDSVAWLETFTPKTRKEIIDLVRESQLRAEGINSKGDVIGLYSFATQLASNGRKQQGDHYTFDDTGEFFRSMFLRVLSNSFTIVADGQKEDENILVKYGDEIIALTDENFERVKIMVRKAYIDYVRRILFGVR
jgi:hypothetical protein